MAEDETDSMSPTLVVTMILLAVFILVLIMAFVGLKRAIGVVP